MIVGLNVSFYIFIYLHLLYISITLFFAFSSLSNLQRIELGTWPSLAGNLSIRNLLQNAVGGGVGLGWVALGLGVGSRRGLYGELRCSFLARLRFAINALV